MAGRRLPSRDQLSSPNGRAALALLLVVFLFGLSVHFTATAASRWPYPDSEQVAEQPENYVGEEVFLFTTYRGSENGIERVSVTYGGTERVFRVTDTHFRVDPGGIVQVYGTVRPGQTIAAQNTIVVNPSSTSNRYKYGVSALGALVVLGVFFRHWTIDWQSLTFERRDDG